MFPFFWFMKGENKMLPINRMISRYNYYNSNTATYLVIHDVGALGQAVANGNYFQVERGASAHYFVDDNNIVQVVEDFHGAWHVGDGNNKYGIHNQNSIGIEMCLNANWQPTEATKQNTVELARYLMTKHNIPIERVVRHYDASRKICPRSLSDNNWAAWYALKARIANTSISTPATGNTHTVASGETLYKIAKLHGTSVAKLKSLNGLSSNTIKIGQVLKVKEATAPAPTPTPAPVTSMNKWVGESGTFTPFFTINVRSGANTNAGVVATYNAGEAIHYDSYYYDGRYTWIHYISFSGAHRYLVCRKNGTAWGAFS